MAHGINWKVKPVNDETLEFMPKFDCYGLIPCVTQSYKTGKVLMVAYMNAEALSASLETGEAHYWSRSRKEIWHKGASSGNIQTIHTISIDCDQDCILIEVSMPEDKNGKQIACHTGRTSCFYRKIIKDNNGKIKLEAINS